MSTLPIGVQKRMDIGKLPPCGLSATKAGATPNVAEKGKCTHVEESSILKTSKNLHADSNFMANKCAVLRPPRNCRITLLKPLEIKQTLWRIFLKSALVKET